MAPHCPKCSTALHEDYGMVTCRNCGTILFVDMEGQAHLGQEIPPSPVTSVGPAPDLSADVASLAFDEPDEPIEADKDVEFPSISHEEFAAEPIAEPMVQNEEPAPSGDFNMDGFLGYQPDSPAEGESGSAEIGDESEIGRPGDPLGINEYANSEFSQAKDGLLLFRLLISGIDSKEMRESLREAMEDARFGWNVPELMSRISKGVLQIENVPPVKATILVNRIKRLALQIRWEQYAITQMDGQMEDPSGSP